MPFQHQNLRTASRYIARERQGLVPLGLEGKRVDDVAGQVMRQTAHRLASTFWTYPPTTVPNLDFESEAEELRRYAGEQGIDLASLLTGAAASFETGELATPEITDDDLRVLRDDVDNLHQHD
jgi:hypothetical protein